MAERIKLTTEIDPNLRYVNLSAIDSFSIFQAKGAAFKSAWVCTKTVHRCSARVMALYSNRRLRSEEHTSGLQSLMRISYAVFCLKKKTNKYRKNTVHKAI